MAERDKPARRPDFLTMLCGLATLAVAGYVLSDGRMWVPVLDLRWIVAGGAVLLGLLFLASSTRRKRD
ncbi:hypothetical protein ACFQV2_35035 [Actinokineospora soli]|uniref:PEP-CTERM protein-sorting domain-containing protein n=1 Tax=Actinokineospora soli TaxID=1048753 RepID=A0ABW2TZJ4_9PSEU